MARKIDEDKIARIKEATMQTIVENGIEDTTIAMIAKNAGVSGGYLYRTYKGKQDLINEAMGVSTSEIEKITAKYVEMYEAIKDNPLWDKTKQDEFFKQFNSDIDTLKQNYNINISKLKLGNLLITAGCSRFRKAEGRGFSGCKLKNL